MHNVTATDVKFNYPIKQFYGKVISDFESFWNLHLNASDAIYIAQISCDQ